MFNTDVFASRGASPKARLLVLEVAKKAALLILQSGGETYRAEDTCKRICFCCGAENVDILAITTGIVLSVEFVAPDEATNHIYTCVVRVQSRSTNLKNVQAVNELSRRITAGKISLEEADSQFDILIARACAPSQAGFFERLVNASYAGVASALFAVLFGGGIFEFLISFLAALLTSFVTSYWNTLKLYYFIMTLLSSMICSAVSVAAACFMKSLNYDVVIIGAIMPLVPGLAITNAVRDTISGDLVSGSARLTEALLTAVAIASGVGLVIGLALSIGVL